MHLYVFSGIVMPERAWFELSIPLKIEFHHAESDIRGIGTIEIFKNNIIYSLKTEKSIHDIMTAKNIISDHVQIILDSVCIDSTVAYLVDIRSLYNSDNGLSTVFGISEPAVGAPNDGLIQVDMFRSLTAAISNTYLRRAIADFRSAIRYPSETGFFTYRAIESIIQDIKIKSNIPDRKKLEAIGILSQLIDIEILEIEFLRSMAADVRHGKPIWISGENRVKCLRIAQSIIRKYILLEN